MIHVLTIEWTSGFLGCVIEKCVFSPKETKMIWLPSITFTDEAVDSHSLISLFLWSDWRPGDHLNGAGRGCSLKPGVQGSPRGLHYARPSSLWQVSLHFSSQALISPPLLFCQVYGLWERRTRDSPLPGSKGNFLHFAGALHTKWRRPLLRWSKTTEVERGGNFRYRASPDPAVSSARESYPQHRFSQWDCGCSQGNEVWEGPWGLHCSWSSPLQSVHLFNGLIWVSIIYLFF